MERVLAKIRKWCQLGSNKSQTKEPTLQLKPEPVAGPVAAAEPPVQPAAVVPPGPGEPLDFDEEWYLRRYPDVAKAVSEGRGKSGLQHYLVHGRREGRLPVPPKPKP
jgi:hypothetical protein